MNEKNKPTKELEWKMHTCCNYQCSYCIDKRSAFLKKPDSESAKKYVRAITKQLQEPWMIQLLGGEPFFDETFLIEAVKEFIQQGHWIKIFTNLSAQISTWKRFIESTYGNIYKIKATYHPDQVDLEAFLKTAKFIKENIHPDTKLKIFSVVLPDVINIRKLNNAKKRFEEAQLEFDVMPMIDTKTDSYHLYTKEELNLIYQFFKKDYKATGSIDNNKGKKCPSGCSYFIINGMDAWACWDAMMKNDKSLWFGNLLDDTFQLPNQEITCPYNSCMCLS